MSELRRRSLYSRGTEDHEVIYDDWDSPDQGSWQVECRCGWEQSGHFFGQSSARAAFGAHMTTVRGPQGFPA